MLHLYNDNSDYSIEIAAVNYVIMHVVFECEIASVAMAGDGRLSLFEHCFGKERRQNQCRNVAKKTHFVLGSRERTLNVTEGEESQSKERNAIY